MKEPDHLYFVAYPIEPDGSRWVKIGRANNVARRLQQIRLGTPRDVDLLGVAVGQGGSEAQVHRGLAHLRGKGEWFLLPAADWQAVRVHLERAFPEWQALVQEHLKNRRAYALAKHREYLAKDDYRERRRAQDRKRYAQDPERFREKSRKTTRSRQDGHRVLESRDHAETD